MTSVIDLREVVDVVIGVDTHVHTHSEAVGRCRYWWRARRDHRGGHGRGLRRAGGVRRRTRHAAGLGDRGDGRSWRRPESASCWISQRSWVELDRPKRARGATARRSDPLDAIRARVRALARTRLRYPRSGGERQALSVLLAPAAPRSAPRPRQTASVQPGHRRPEPIRAGSAARSCPGCSPPPPACAFTPPDVETTTTVLGLRSLARRFRALTKGAAEHQKAILAIIRSWRPDLLEQFGVGPIVAGDRAVRLVHPDGSTRSRVRNARRRRTIPANSGQVTTAPTQPPRATDNSNRALHTIAQSRTATTTHPRLRRPPHHRGQDHPRDKRCLYPLHRPRPLPPPRKRHTTLTNHRSVG